MIFIFFSLNKILPDATIKILTTRDEVSFASFDTGKNMYFHHWVLLMLAKFGTSEGLTFVKLSSAGFSSSFCTEGLYLEKRI